MSCSNEPTSSHIRPVLKTNIVIDTWKRPRHKTWFTHRKINWFCCTRRVARCSKVYLLWVHNLPNLIPRHSTDGRSKWKSHYSPICQACQQRGEIALFSRNCKSCVTISPGFLRWPFLVIMRCKPFSFCLQMHESLIWIIRGHVKFS